MFLLLVFATPEQEAWFILKVNHMFIACSHDTHLLYYFVLFVYALQIMAMVTTGIEQFEVEHVI